MNGVQHMGTIAAVTLIRTDTGRCIPGESPPFRPHVATLDFSLLGGSENFEGKNQIKLDIVSFLHATLADDCSCDSSNWPKIGNNKYSGQWGILKGKTAPLQFIPKRPRHRIQVSAIMTDFKNVFRTILVVAVVLLLQFVLCNFPKYKDSTVPDKTCANYMWHNMII